jgi:hypothetical protein
MALLDDPECVRRRAAVAKQLMEDADFVARYRAAMARIPRDDEPWNEDRENPAVLHAESLIQETP